MDRRLVRSYGKKASEVEEEGSDALEVGPQTHATEDAQDGAEESIEDLPISRTEWSAGSIGELFIRRRHLLRRI
jgi:hypothetical protein